MVILGAMALAGALALGSMTASWDNALRGSVTVQVPHTADDVSESVEKIVRLIEATSGVVSVRSLDEDQIASLLAPWLGDDIGAADLPIPYLIDVTIDDGAKFVAADLASRLNDVVSGVAVDDHRTWLDQLVNLVRTVQILGYITVALIAFCAVSAVIFATRSELAIHRPVVELLHLIGARDSYIARQFQFYAVRLSLRGSLLGAVGVVAMLGVVVLVGRDFDTLLIPRIQFAPWQWTALAAVPIATPLIALMTARLTVMRSLAQMA